ncbi:exported hypothetical protein [Hyella patelloides LEGE 07179]|uniref:DUF4864 domain-containing protein n=1 Tax=Hyella patelloides LEGE 07179 TaxID=945734 RepID=A0A563VTY8_9CYAN|nr:hypothetical protein [Hyella patelloides]VEP14839.1 exported hypothetical protein [Hyella patelloides LEGE 07179]
MNTKFLHLLIFGIFSVIPISKANAQSPTQLPVESYRIDDVREFNSQLISELSGADVDTWQAKPLFLAMKYLNGASFGRFGQITRKIPQENTSEYPDTMIVTVIQDGYKNDSVRGEWVQLTFKRNREGIWLIQESKRAFLCWRGENTKAFQQEFCP